jgi:C4-type Zn-finger protein
MVKCPKCKYGELKENISYEGILFNIKKVITTYCQLCDFRNRVVFPATLT